MPCLHSMLLKNTPIQLENNVRIVPSSMYEFIDHSLITAYHINIITGRCCQSFCQIRVIKWSITLDAGKTLFCCLVMSWIDYCNHFFAGLPPYSISTCNLCSTPVLESAIRVESMINIVQMSWMMNSTGYHLISASISNSASRCI